MTRTEADLREAYADRPGTAGVEQRLTDWVRAGQARPTRTGWLVLAAVVAVLGVAAAVAVASPARPHRKASVPPPAIASAVRPHPTPLLSGHPTASPPTVSGPAACANGAASFSFLLAAGLRGTADPISAARTFVAHGGVKGYAPPAGAVWRVTPIRAGTAFVYAGPVSLEVIQLPNKTWAVDAGSRCT